MLCVYVKVDLFGVKTRNRGRVTDIGVKRLELLETILPANDKFVIDIQQPVSDPALISGEITYSAEIAVYHRSSPEQMLPHVFILPHLIVPQEEDWAKWLHEPSELARTLVRKVLDHRCLTSAGVHPSKWDHLMTRLTKESSHFNKGTDTLLQIKERSQYSSTARVPPLY